VLEGLFRTTVFRLSLLYAVVFSLVAASALGVLHWATKSELRDQNDARLRLETEVLLERYPDQRIPALLETVRQQNEQDGRNRVFFYRVLGPLEQRLISGALADIPAGPGPGPARTYADMRLGDALGLEPGTLPYDVPVRVLVTDLRGGYRLVVGRDVADQRVVLDHTFQVALVATGVTFLLALLGGGLMGMDVLRRIQGVRRAADDIMAGDLSRRLAVGTRDDEFDQLSVRLNAMLERIEQLMTGLREVTDNVAHDLRSPLTRMRNRLEVTLLEARDQSEYRQVMGDTVDDADQLIRTFNALLAIARAEAGVGLQDSGEVDLATLTEEVAELYEGVAEDKSISLDTRIEPGLRVRGNRQLLAQALTNLLDNAFKYSPAGGRVELRAAADPQGPVLSVSDTGPGIPEAERERVQQRFVRLESSRSTPGSGLGLSLVKAVARLHQATLTLTDAAPGLRAALHFPSLYPPRSTKKNGSASLLRPHQTPNR